MPGASISPVDPFVFLALALAVFTAGVLVVVIRELVRNVRKLTGQIRATTDRLTPLTEELQAELAVTTTEVEGLSRSVARVQEERSARPQRRRPKRKG